MRYAIGIFLILTIISGCDTMVAPENTDASVQGVQMNTEVLRSRILDLYNTEVETVGKTLGWDFGKAEWVTLHKSTYSAGGIGIIEENWFIQPRDGFGHVGPMLIYSAVTEGGKIIEERIKKFDPRGAHNLLVDSRRIRATIEDQIRITFTIQDEVDGFLTLTDIEDRGETFHAPLVSAASYAGITADGTRISMPKAWEHGKPLQFDFVAINPTRPEALVSVGWSKLAAAFPEMDAAHVMYGWVNDKVGRIAKVDPIVMVNQSGHDQLMVGVPRAPVNEGTLEVYIRPYKDGRAIEGTDCVAIRFSKFDTRIVHAAEQSKLDYLATHGVAGTCKG